MSPLAILLGLGGLAVVIGAIWLRRAQARFEAGLRAEGNPIADHRSSKDYRREFTAWIFGMGAAERSGKALRTLMMLIWLVALAAAAAWSLLPAELWE